MKNNAELEKITLQLEAIAERPSMFLGNEDNTEGAHLMLWGFNMGLLRLLEDGSFSMPNFLEAGHKARGWDFTAFGPEAQMRERGLNDSQIVQELIQISIACWRAFFTKN